MQVGNLVTILRDSGGVPANTIALVVKHWKSDMGPGTKSFDVWHVVLLNGRKRRYLTEDLEVVSESR